jgi:tetratricopeptide (TPR) repeat protein
VIKKLILILLLLAPASAFAGVDDDFRAAISLYDQGKFVESATSFQNIVDKGYSSPQLFYNAGCAYYKAGRMGLAIANFRRAERLAPEDADIKANLEFARLYTVDKIEADQKGIFQTQIDSVLNVLSPNQYFLISLAALALIFALLALRRMGKVNIGSTTIVGLSLVVVLSGAAMVLVLQHNYLTEEGVITVEQTEIMSGPGSEFELQFEAHEGLMFQILESRPDYYLALFANQLKGWVRRSDVVTI